MKVVKKNNEACEEKGILDIAHILARKNQEKQKGNEEKSFNNLKKFNKKRTGKASFLKIASTVDELPVPLQDIEE